MPLSQLSPLVSRLLGLHETTTSRSAANSCPHCGLHSQSWPSGLKKDGDPRICTGCGGLHDRNGSALTITRHSAQLGPLEGAGTTKETGNTAFAAFREAPSARVRQHVINALKAKYSVPQVQRLSAYIVRVLQELGSRNPLSPAFIDVGEPAIASTGAGSLVLSLGLLATLEDEAQLAFILARELALESAGWPQRRLFAAMSEKAPTLAWLFKPTDPVAQGLELSLRVGYGPEIEGSVDREAMSMIVRAGYDAAAAARALRLLESASLSGRGGRFLLAAERAARLSHATETLSPHHEGRLNREVYRRAIGGFQVFAASS